MSDPQPQPPTSKTFEQVLSESKEIKSEIYHLEKIRGTRMKKFNDAMDQYRSYIKKENELIDRNFRHCEQRNKWYTEQIDISWRNAKANRHIVLRSIARTNVLKRDLDEWLARIDENTLKGEQNNSYLEQSQLANEYLQGSQLIDKYNDILHEYGHRI